MLFEDTAFRRPCLPKTFPRGTTINSRRTAAFAAAAALAALSVPGITTGASAAVTDLYVNNAAAAHCSDAGHGTTAQPYCTVSAAAKTVEPGQTVHIAAGDYPEQVTLTRSGTAAAPITFTGVRGPLTGDASDYVGSKGYLHQSSSRHTVLGARAVQHGLVIDGAAHVLVQDLELSGSASATLIDGGSDVTVQHTSSLGTTAFDLKGTTHDVTIRQNFGSRGTFARLAAGVRGTVIATNLAAEPFAGPAILADSAPDTVIVGNTLERWCDSLIKLTGSSTGATIENNVFTNVQQAGAEPGCGAPASTPQLSVAAEATSGTKVAYNTYSADNSPVYQWAGTVHRTVAAFAAASGQGGHDIIGDSNIRPVNGDSGKSVSPVVDSADESAPGMTATDLKGDTAVDDPYAPNNGTGSGLRDRGAFEIDSFAARYTPVGPVRILDTRTGMGIAVAPGGTLDLPVLSLNGVAIKGMTAVTMNVTVTGGTGPGYLTVYPTGAERPTASSLNWTPGQTIPNLVTAKVNRGKVSFYNGSQGTVHIVADLLGTYSTAEGSGYTSTTPTRLLDTRDGTGAPKTPLTNGKPIDLQIAGLKDVPKDITAVTLNVTATDTTDQGYLTVYPHGSARPTASNLNWPKGKTIPNLVTVPVKDGKVSLVTGGTYGSVNVVADLAGYFTATGGDSYHALTPYRIIDTRSDDWIPNPNDRYGAGHPGPVAPHRAPTFGTDTPDATAVALNVTVTGGTAPGYLTAFPYDTDRPLASNLNWTTGETIPNQVVVKPGFGAVDLYNGSNGPVHVVADVNGYYAR
ncbi:hypothetical protein CFP65_3837 [Kitasatospora sp. MMS16-BH015]|uniref:right-handed parallel beta-helix repeat-containing protein n=1 Tax=Kitasatospora sp. MMS16-BH015 TaxID=2018025 RepID=UPI000CA17CC4|nr:right-handed parallel beta-helix repeat-containing protein [Kitasatospora sp. MMS16-BH015]AUG78617.1 hypothetical protein CFP65_3837 [Kitasatospora sp. MMS16-BH015]